MSWIGLLVLGIILIVIGVVIKISVLYSIGIVSADIALILIVLSMTGILGGGGRGHGGGGGHGGGRRR